MQNKIITITFTSILCLVILNSCHSFMSSPPPAVITPAPKIIEQPLFCPVKKIPNQAQFLMTQDPAISRAFILYQNTGKAPTIASTDFLQFPFGKSEPLVYCQPLHSCDIALEPGEQITAVFFGDTARWLYTQAISGAANNAQPHVIIKPKDYDIATNVIITTTRRTYHLGVVSKQNSYVKEVSFWYPDDIQAKWQQANQLAQSQWQQQNQTEIAELPNINLNNLNFNYRIDAVHCSPAWKPLRAFNDGSHVYIQMPPSLSTTDAPVLFVQSGGGQQALVNYRMRGNYYIVDQLFQQAFLIAGVGSQQQRVTISSCG